MSDELATRDSRRFLSKSFLTGADFCGQRAWLDLNDPRPFRMTEPVAFGKAVDLGVQIVLRMLDAGLDPRRESERLVDPVLELLSENVTEPEVSSDDVLRALDLFIREVVDTDLLPLNGAKLQHHIRMTLEDLGEVDAHPDLILRDGSVVDVKTSARAKPEDAAATSYLELGFYALLREIETGSRVPRVGYLTFIRGARPRWQLVEAPVSESMLAIARTRATAVRRARDADRILNEGAENPVNWTFPTGPRFSGLCGSCSHNPANGGRCTITEG